MRYFYDENGDLIGFNLTNATYPTGSNFYYVRNGQNDIIGIVNSTGSSVVSYLYDSWVKLISTTGTLATTIGVINPYRYRGYRYDVETGLYYVTSRYYDPNIGRFLNADDLVSGIGQSVQGCNQYSYCLNNPINMTDSDGHLPKWAIITLGITAAVAAVALTIITVGAAGPAAACTLTMIGTSLGASYAVASAAATTAVVLTTVAASAYAGDIAYSAVTGMSPMKETIFKGSDEAYENGLLLVSIATAGMLEMASLNLGACFVAGTAVLASRGLLKIEEIKTGDFVWAENPETGEKGLKRVVQTFINETAELVHVTVNDEEIVTTPDHPFYVPQQGWTGAIHLRAGDVLVLSNGEYVTVEKVQHEILETPIKVYNFEVEDFHTYYVGDSSVLVHNACTTRSGAVKQAWQQEADTVQKTGRGQRSWSTSEIDELLTFGKVKGYQGHHIQSVSGFPELAGNSSNIQFLTRVEHLAAHGGNWRNITSIFYEIGG